MADITITEGDTLEVDYNLENTGDGTGTFDPSLLVQGVQEDQDTGITLDPTQTATGTLSWPTESGDAVTDALAEAVTDDTSDSITVTVENAIPDVPTNQLQHRYQFNDNSNSTVATDSVGSADGSITGATYSTTAREGDYALDFGGGDYYVDAFGNTNVTNTTINVWVYFDSLNTNQAVHHSTFGSPYDLRLTSSNEWDAAWNNGSGYVNTTVPVNASAGEWVMLTQVWDTNTGGTFYVNGSEVGTAGSGGDPNQGGNPFRIGSDRSGNSWTGGIDDLLYYDRALSASEIADLYNEY